MMKKIFTFALMLTTLLASSTVFALNIYYPTDGIYSIQPKFAPNKELSVQGHASNWGANVIIDNLSSGWQKWKIQRIPGTHFYSIVAVSSNLAIDVANAQASDGANIATWPFLEGRQNQFAFFDAGGSCYVIKANLDGNFVLDVERAENRAGANVLSWSFNGGDNQLWRLVMIRRLPEFQSYNKKATRKVTAYVMPDLQARSGNEWVDAGDNVTVLREEGNAYLVRYPVSGGTKTRWVNKNEIFSGSTPNSGNVNVNHNPQGNVQIAESTQPNTLHVKGTAFDQDNPNGSIRLHVYVGGTPGSNVPQYEIRTNGSNRVFDDTRKIDSNYSGNQLVHIYALNDYGSGNNVEIWNGYVNIQGNNPTPSGNFIYPVEGNTTITTLFYYENKSRALGHKHSVWWHPYEGGYFNALDISCPKGTPVKAVASGKVSNEYSTNSSNIIVIEHNDSQIGKSLYAHLDEKLVKPGDIIYAGQIIGKSGDKGASWTDTNGVLHHAYHLHMEWFNSSPWEYYRDKVSFRYSISTLNAYNKWVKTLKEANQQDKEKFEAAINWVNNYPKNNGGFRY